MQKQYRLNKHEPVIWKALNRFGSVLENVTIDTINHQVKSIIRKLQKTPGLLIHYPSSTTPFQAVWPVIQAMFFS